MSDDPQSPDPRPQSGSFDGPVHRYALRVFYEDTDAGGVVYHANYIRWFERARSDLLDLLDIDQRAALESGEGLYTVAEVNIRYLSPARLGDGVVIDTHALQVGRVSCTLRQVARRGKTRLAEATVKVGFISPEGRPRRQPEAWQQAFAQILQSSSQDFKTGPEGLE
ncbi:acyl-CoA thioester hydrolase [Novosphingobium sp. PhB165]|uniref:YbgC/FadM family acyl-CoA thioesterase n=1 Tax=Novosphingobium sp. PhB165 TaxID=2485105 RepID=UPI00104681B3|nr:YbgC/FadM family acyl-CoA thioesterase [Novosphingobium sp. PhB165]TCM19023.1 acyl-CoA thioester hydrolase [Novosphingobium sp. PhB165]